MVNNNFFIVPPVFVFKCYDGANIIIILENNCNKHDYQYKKLFPSMGPPLEGAALKAAVVNSGRIEEGALSFDA
jgi:hypothetical protein